MDLLENTIQEYAWGSHSAIATFLGQESPSPRPQAEMWMGAHPSASSRTSRSNKSYTLLELVGAMPDRELGRPVASAFQNRLPFLLKIIAAEQPLSLQAHPNIEQAIQGFNREEEAQIAITAPNRLYKDQNHKPELVCALTPFEALCGFRDPAETIQLFERLQRPDIPGLAKLIDHLQSPSGSETGAGLRGALEYLLTMPKQAAQEMLDPLVLACEEAVEKDAAYSCEYSWAIKLAKLYPGDIGAVCALLLNLVHLEPGQAIFLDAGRLHAYLGGLAIEIMANSDNVLRCGLTPKHVDALELIRVLHFEKEEIFPGLPKTDGLEEIFESPAAEFRLSRFCLRKGLSVQPARRGPEIVICTEGHFELSAATGGLALSQGKSAFIPACDPSYLIVGEGTLFRATPKLEASAG